MIWIELQMRAAELMSLISLVWGALIEETWYVCGVGLDLCQKLFQRRQLFLRPPPANLSLLFPTTSICYTFHTEGPSLSLNQDETSG